MSRKRSLPAQAARPAKRAKTEESGEDRVAALEAQVTLALDSSSSLNPLLDLISLAADSDARLVHKAIYALYRLFTRIHTSGLLTVPAVDGSDAALVKAWTVERYSEYVDTLCRLLRHDEPALRTAALDILMSLLKSSSTAISSRSGQPRFDAVHFRKIVTALLVGRPDLVDGDGSWPRDSELLESDMRALFLDKWLSVNDDVRWFFMREATHILQRVEPSSGTNALTENVLSLLERLTTMPTDKSELNSFWVNELARRPNSTPESTATAEEVEDPNDWLSFFDEPQNTEPVKERLGRTSKLSTLQSLHHLPSHKAEFSFAWLGLLSHLSSPSLAGRALTVLHKLVLPHFTRPLRLMDWISACVDHGGVIGLLALNALFTLMRDHNLDYPNFYTRLYGFLNRDVLHLKYRARFFRLMELFLSSTHLPTTLLASFVKRLSRLSLSAPPSAIVMIIPFTYNILKQHPALMTMIHREQGSDMTIDPFDADDPNPLTTNAIASSLWELNSHREHYFSGVSTMARILSEPFTKPAYALEDFLDHTYGTIFEAEARRRIKKEPAFAEPYSGPPFPKQESQAVPDPAADVIGELWSF